jgi:hypothetical protein
VSTETFATLKWTGHEGKVTFTDAFNEAPWITKADAIQDCIVHLQIEYRRTLEESERKFLESKRQASK